MRLKPTDFYSTVLYSHRLEVSLSLWCSIIFRFSFQAASAGETPPPKCFQTKPIKRIMQMVWKCAPLTVWGATDNQTTALSCVACILLNSTTLWILCLGGGEGRGFFGNRLIWFIFSQCLFFCRLSQKTESVWMQRWLMHPSPQWKSIC